MVSDRKRKKQARMQGLSEPELAMFELLEQVLDRFRWLQVLTHTQSYLLREKLKISQEELDQVLEAASRTVDKDGQLGSWYEELDRIKSLFFEGRRGIRREKKLIRREAKTERKSRAASIRSQAEGGAANGGAAGGGQE
ncbi:MAG: hypothetical protein CSA62_14230 [Planctomycetota bacterium]|nr:MAG: hypothetical protein CSA62_14230 [Planctomycetota bacterium]